MRPFYRQGTGKTRAFQWFLQAGTSRRAVPAAGHVVRRRKTELLPRSFRAAGRGRGSTASLPFSSVKGIFRLFSLFFAKIGARVLKPGSSGYEPEQSGKEPESSGFEPGQPGSKPGSSGLKPELSG
jgi:hypothetical protein